MRKVTGRSQIVRRIFIGVFVALVVSLSLYMFDIYRQATPPKYVYAFIALGGAFILAEVFVYKFVRKRFDDDPTMRRLVDLVSYVIFGILLYLFAVYVYPAM